MVAACINLTAIGPVTLTGSSRSVYPIKENTRTASAEGTVIAKSPLAEVSVPVVVPCTLTVTKGSVSPVASQITRPVTCRSEGIAAAVAFLSENEILFPCA
jgi:beta-lactam-binding protein with PASTA domain